MEKNIPSKTVTDKHSQPWIDSGVRRALRKKRKLYRKARKSNSHASWATLRKHRRSLDRRIRNQHRDYLSGTVGASRESNNTKPFWNYIKSLKLNSFGIPSLTTESGRTVTSFKDKADALNHQFQFQSFQMNLPKQCHLWMT